MIIGQIILGLQRLRCFWRYTLACTLLPLAIAGSILAQSQTTATGAEPSATPLTAPEVLHTALEVRQLKSAPPDSTSKPVSLKGTVTFVHTERQTFYVTDPTGSVAVTLADERLLPPLVGDLVTLTGTAAPGSRIPMVRTNAIVVEKKVMLPPAQETSFEEALSGSEEAQWVEIQGQLRQVDVLDGWVRLTLGAAAGDFSVSIASAERPQVPIGASLRVRGICSTWMISRSQKIGGFFLFTPSPSNIEVIATSGNAPELTQVNQLQRLRADEAKAGRSVMLRGVVTFAHADQRIFYLNDASGGVLAWIDENTVTVNAKDPTDRSSSLPPVGSYVTVRGVTTAGVFSASVHANDIEIRGSRPLPVPKAVSLEQAMTGSEDGQWVEMRGHLRQIDVFGSWLRLTLTANVGDFLVSIPRAAGTDIKVGSLLRVRGVCQPWLNEKLRIGGIFLYAPSLNNIEVAETALADPFAAPEETINNLQHYRTQTLQQQQVLVRGNVLHHERGRYVVVENASGVVRALSQSDQPLTPGDQVEVVGFPGRQGNRSVLRGAVYRRTGSGPAPTAKTLNAVDGLKVDPALDGRLVTATGTLVNRSWRTEETRVMLQVGDTVLDIVYLGKIPSDVPAEWETNSMIQVSGFYWTEYDENDLPSKFSILLRTPADLVVLKQPPWWTAGRALAAVGLFGACLLLGLAWVAILHRQVRRQTGVIRAQLEKETNLQVRHGEIIANASDMIFTTDLAGKFTSFNPAGERTTGYNSAEALRIGIRELIAPDDEATATALIELARKPEQTPAERFETRFKTNDNRLIWMEICARPIQDAGKPAGLLAIARDITERKQIEDELRRARTAAEATTQAKSAFLANMSHEIRTPLSGVIGMSNLLLDTKLHPEQRDFAETIHNSAQSLMTILNDILDFSKIEAGKLQFEHTAFDLTSPIEDSIGLLTARAHAKAVHLLPFIPPDLPRHLLGDPSRLRQVLMNLLGNAVKFTEKGDVLVEVSRETETTTHIQLRFEISDTGIGMNEETQQMLFSPFSQADASTTRRFGGTGLGLAISKQLVELMGGKIGVRSQLGHGSTFWFTVNLEKQTLPDGSVNTEPSRIVGGKRILAVGDHAGSLRIVSRYLEAWALHGDTAGSKDDALTLALNAAQDTRPYHLVVLDNDMADTDAVSLACALRSNAALAGLPLIVLTSLERQIAKEEIPGNGKVRILKKPVRQDDLKRALLRLLGDAPDKDSLPPQTASDQPPDLPKTNPALRVIVAEDNLVNQRIIDMQLKKFGIATDLAGSGHELLAALEKKPYDLVFMDCQMPEMDGYEATRRIRASGRFPKLRIVAMTANAMQGDREKCLAAGMDDYTSKPVRVQELRRVLESQPD